MTERDKEPPDRPWTLPEKWQVAIGLAGLFVAVVTLLVQYGQ